jgi:hypothetical protein
MEQAQLPEWESLLIDEAIDTAEQRYRDEQTTSRNKDVELRRQQAYHRLALEIDRPAKRNGHAQHPGQLSFFPTDPTLFDPAD